MNESENNKDLNVILKKFGDDMPNQISLAIKEILETESKDIDFWGKANIEPLDKIIYDYMKKIDSNLKNISKKIAEALG
jgi:hypothetical protein